MHNFNFDWAFRLTKIALICSLSLLISCNNEKSKFSHYPQGTISFDSGEQIKVYIADTAKRQKQGLSNTTPNQFGINDGMMFPENGMAPRQFWMPETYFNLDIIFLTAEMYVLDIHKNIEHCTFRSPRSKIPLSKTVNSQHVLEIRADSPFAKMIKPGMILNWNSKIKLELK